MCPNCLSLERHRLCCLYFKKTINKDVPLKLLHFAPEKFMETFFRSHKNIEYLSVDFKKGAAMQIADITNLPFKNKTFDFVYCSHVLEHIEDDLRAMREIKRVLTPKGIAILQVPIADKDDTFEDFTITNPDEREKIFGQKDHVRRYGRDYTKKLTKAGFQVEQIYFCKEIGEEATRRFALLPNNGKCTPTEGVIFKCKKPRLNLTEEEPRGPTLLTSSSSL